MEILIPTPREIPRYSPYAEGSERRGAFALGYEADTQSDMKIVSRYSGSKAGWYRGIKSPAQAPVLVLYASVNNPAKLTVFIDLRLKLNYGSR